MKRTGTHHTLIAAVHTYIKKKRLLRPGHTVIAAVSGGVDSMVMLHVLASIQQLWKMRIVVAHVNFELRGIDSVGDEAFVKKAAKQNGFPFYSKTEDTRSVARERKQSLQETARDIRYEFFDTLKHLLNADAIATAHHADDNTETMLINLLRGSGLDGLAGIPPSRDAVIRPLLCVTREQIAAYAKQFRIAYRDDSSNASNDYTRNFLRNSIIPKLQQRINPSLNETLMHEADLFRSAADYMHHETDAAFAESVTGRSINVKTLSAYHQFIQQSVIHRLLKALMIEPSIAGVTAVQELMEQQKGSTVELQKQWAAERLSNTIIIREQGHSAGFHFSMEKPGRLSTTDFTVTVKKSALPDNKRRSGSSKEYVDAANILFPLTVRSWKQGDSFFPLGMHGKKKLSDFFGGLKLSAEEKMKIPVVESNGTIVWIAGQRLDERYKLTDSTTAAYSLTVQFHGKKERRRK